MHVLPNTQVPIGVPSPTLTNPEMILPNSSASSPSMPRQHQRHPSPPSIGSIRHGRSESAPDEKLRVKGAMYSPFRNGVLRRHNGSVTRRSNSESGDKRNAIEKNPLPYQQGEEASLASSPTLHEDLYRAHSGRLRKRRRNVQHASYIGRRRKRSLFACCHDSEGGGDPGQCEEKAYCKILYGPACLGVMSLTPSRTWREISIELEVLSV